jgi:YHS domain-containing protein
MKFLAIILSISLAGACSDKTAPRSKDSVTQSLSLKNYRQNTGPKTSCPVCGLEFPQNEALKKYKYKGEIYYFYIEDHYNTFKSNPESYISPKEAAQPVQNISKGQKR